MKITNENYHLLLKKTCLSFLLMVVTFSFTLLAQDGKRHYDTNPSSIDLSLNTPNSVKMKDMVGINENGYIFWDHVYNSNTQTVVNPTVADAFESTFSKMRIFHLADKDYNLNSTPPAATKYPFESTIMPCTGSNENTDRNYMCANRDFYQVLRSRYDFISSASSVSIGDYFDANGNLVKHGFPDGWFSLSEWGGANAKQKAYEYAVAYLETMDPDPNNSNIQPLVDRFYTSNEIWGNSVGAAGYQEIIDGFIEGFAEYYQNDRLATPNPNQWNIKMWLGSFQAHKTSTVWGDDYVGDMISDKAKLALEGIDIHPYSFLQDAPNNSSPFITEHPESTISYFQSIKNMVQWRDNNPDNNIKNMKISATEFGWNDAHAWADRILINVDCNDIDPECGCDCSPGQTTQQVWVMEDINGGPATQNNPQNWKLVQNGVGQEAQAIYTTRAYLMMARYGLESAYIYAATNNNEITFQNCGVYGSEPLIEQVNSAGNFKISNYPGANGPFTTEKKIMPAMRKLQDDNIIGDKKYLQTLSEVDGGVYAYLLGDDASNPTHLVAWHAEKINNLDESAILGMTTNASLSSIGFPANLSLNTSVSGYTRLDWKDGSINTNNIPVSSVFNNNTLTLTPIPIVIPLGGNTGGPITFNNCPSDITVSSTQVVSWNEPTAVTTCPSTGGCNTPPNKTGFTSLGENGSSYFYITNPGSTKPWNDARADCVANGGNLADFHSATEYDFVRNQITNLNEQIFIGLYQDNNSSVWKWVTNDPVTYTNWDNGQPNSTGQAATLAPWTGPPFKWVDQTKNAWKRYILEVPCSGGGGSGTADVTITGPEITLNGSSVSRTKGTTWSPGVYTLTYTGTDPCGNSETCSFTVTVNPPTETCFDGILNQNETGIDCGGVCPACPPPGGTDVQVTVSANPVTVGIWNTLTLTVKVKNVGTNPINQNFIVDHIIPASMKQVGGNPPSATAGTLKTWCASGPCWEWTVPSLAVGDEETLTLPLFQTAIGAFDLTAFLQDPASFGDTNPSNNSASTSVFVTSNLSVPNMVNFSATKKGITSEVKWIMNKDEHIDLYEVEVSADGNNFRILKEVNAIGLNNITEYKAMDMNPTIGENFYRLKIYELDGSSYYSSTRRLNFDIDFGKVILYPSPTSRNINILLKDFAGLEGTVQIYNSLGQKMTERNYVSFPTLPVEFNIEKFIDGIYTVSIKVDNQRTFTKRFIVNKL